MKPANAVVSQVLNTLQPCLCDGAMLEQIDWAVRVLAEESSRMRSYHEVDYQPRKESK